MSYSVDLGVDLGGPEPISLGMYWNYTSNCSPMWNAAGIHIHEWDGKTAEEVGPQLAWGLALMVEDPEAFIKFNPDNGWGDFYSLRDELGVLLRHFARAPKAIVRVSR